jgi:predicted phage baseplate assembly protein
MPLPTANLDDRRFQDIVDQAKRMIPQYCPEWTDHNVSDPGVTLIELFAWMTEMLLYRVNQVPEKMYVKFLELLGVRLEPPRAAQAPVTFYLSAPQPNTVVIPADTEVATVRTETSPAVIFTTEAVRPVVAVLGRFTT